MSSGRASAATIPLCGAQMRSSKVSRVTGSVAAILPASKALSALDLLWNITKHLAKTNHPLGQICFPDPRKSPEKHWISGAVDTILLRLAVGTSTPFCRSCVFLK